MKQKGPQGRDVHGGAWSGRTAPHQAPGFWMNWRVLAQVPPISRGCCGPQGGAWGGVAWRAHGVHQRARDCAGRLGTALVRCDVCGPGPSWHSLESQGTLRAGGLPQAPPVLLCELTLAQTDCTALLAAPCPIHCLLARVGDKSGQCRASPHSGCMVRGAQSPAHSPRPPPPTPQTPALCVLVVIYS